MGKRLLLLLLTILLTSACSKPGGTPTPVYENQASSNIIPLPAPVSESDISIEEALANRRSVREFKDETLQLSEISQLLWAAQGISHESGKRTAPSAGALYPLEIYLITGQSPGLEEGVYKYLPLEHALLHTSDFTLRSELAAAALNQEPVRDAPVLLLICAVYERTTEKYGDRGQRYVHMEVGFASQNIYLQAESLGLGTVFIGAFYEDQVKEILDLPDDETPLGLMPVGKILE
jgi:SagB-type dehydrogenase family enzyme